ncbi:CPBP family glutamic-type intramembrane protease [Spirillospora sp. CA-128828]|uniref:CPBP family glutamic-type intramembrane protease n=1 Tax=Spirillospora sp. CA-128828 TaxID=3240033 RepID=UPI003D8E995D
MSFEELVFRGVIVGSSSHLGEGAACVLSVALFATVQVFYTPGWRTAMFPVIGALITGVVHGILFLPAPNIWPLIVAHCVYFFSAMRALRSFERGRVQ